MSLGKRHIGRRVAGVGVAVGLMVLGLEAPAFAAPPTVTGVSPTSGPANCIAVVTGTAFTDSPVGDTDVTFDGPVNVLATDIAIASATELWVRVPAALVEGDTYTILVENNGGTANGGTFLATTDGCAPTITSFTPTCGGTDTTVVITGTNLLAGTDPTTAADEADVRFFDYSGADAIHTVPNVDSSTQISVIVPSSAADGPIRVTTDVATAGFSATPFLKPPPDCVAAVPTAHARSISFKIKSTGKASGVVTSTEDPAFTDCVAAVPVKIQKKTSSGWKTVGKTTTTDTGSYTKKVKNPKGKQKFRALAPKVSLGDPVTDTCTKAKSATRKI
jgi:hypothetical protein